MVQGGRPAFAIYRACPQDNRNLQGHDHMPAKAKQDESHWHLHQEVTITISAASCVLLWWSYDPLQQRYMSLFVLLHAKAGFEKSSKFRTSRQRLSPRSCCHLIWAKNLSSDSTIRGEFTNRALTVFILSRSIHSATVSTVRFPDFLLRQPRQQA